MIKRDGPRRPNDPRSQGQRKHGRAVKSRVPIYKSEWYQDNKTRLQSRMRVNHLRRAYGLTEQDYSNMLKSQNGKCAICKGPPRSRRLHVDHCHDTNSVRGLLCANCNTSLSVLENASFMLQAMQYLGRTS